MKVFLRKNRGFQKLKISRSRDLLSECISDTFPACATCTDGHNSTPNLPHQPWTDAGRRFPPAGPERLRLHSLPSLRRMQSQIANALVKSPAFLSIKILRSSLPWSSRARHDPVAAMGALQSIDAPTALPLSPGSQPAMMFASPYLSFIDRRFLEPYWPLYSVELA